MEMPSVRPTIADNPEQIIAAIRRGSAGLVQCGHNAVCLRYQGRTWPLHDHVVQALQAHDWTPQRGAS